jgi:hypothetical protein
MAFRRIRHPFFYKNRDRTWSATHTCQHEPKKGATTMASIKMISEEEATGEVKEIYEEIKSQLGIDFVPNLYRVMAAKPDYLKAN